MNFTQLRAFDMVAREGSFSKAAAQLGLTQPALTIQVKALEEAYGCKIASNNDPTWKPTLTIELIKEYLISGGSRFASNRDPSKRDNPL